MTVRFPVKAERHAGSGDIPPGPPTYAIFDANGYWANLGGIFFQMPAKDGNAGTVDGVARMLNAAYEQGRTDAQAEVRQALGIEP
jgi:hypothetical protein